MKKNITATLLVVMIVLNLILLFRTRALEQNIQNLQHEMFNQFSHVLSKVNDISYNVSSTLERQASIFENISWSFGTLNSENMTIPLVVSVVPKEAITTTTATLTANGVSVPMIRNGVNFGAEIPVDLFKPLETYVTFESEGNQSSQRLDTIERPFEEELLMLDAQNEGGSTFEHYSGKYTFEGKVHIDIKTPDDNPVTSLKIVTTDNDVPLQESMLNANLLNKPIDYKVEIKFEANHTYETAVIATDSYGLTYRTIIDRQITDAGATSPSFGEMDYWGSMVILDKDGTVLYDSAAEFR